MKTIAWRRMAAILPPRVGAIATGRESRELLFFAIRALVEMASNTKPLIPNRFSEETRSLSQIAASESTAAA
jgi:hypothetical protein